MRNLRHFLPALILLLGCAGMLRTKAQRAVASVAPMKSVAPAYGDYAVVEQTLSKDEIEVAGMTDYAARAYVRDSVAAFTTFVSYYDRQSQGHTIHSPRNCLPGAGWEVFSPGTRVIDRAGRPAEVNRYVLKNGLETALVLYWYQGRDRVVASEYVVKWNLLRDAALLGHTEEALVRVVVPVQRTAARNAAAGDSIALRSADSLATVVATRLMASVDRVLPQR
jgi:EpsI family protein